MHVLGTRVLRRLGVERSASSPKAAQALGCSLTPGLRISFGRVTCMARAASVPGLWALGFLLLCGVCVLVGLRLVVGFVNPASPGWGLGWVCLGTVCGVVPLLPAVCGVRGWALVSACVWDVCGFLRASLALRRFRFRCAVWACVLGRGLGCAPPFLAGLSGCVFCPPPFFFGFVVSVAGCPCIGPCCPGPPIPFLSGWAAGPFFFVCVCMFRCPLSRWAAVLGFVLPVLAGWFPCASLGVLSLVPSGWGVWPPLVVLAGGLVAVCCFRPPPPSPLCFFLAGGASQFLPLPSLGWRKHWPAFTLVFRAAVGGCVLFGRVPATWVGWAMYMLGSAPLLAGLGPGSAGLAAAPGGCVWLGVRGLGLFVYFPLCGADFNLLNGPTPLLLGERWPRAWPAVPVCGVLVRRLPGFAVACFG